MIARLRWIAVAAALALGACATPADRAHTLVVADGAGDVSGLNPHLYSGATNDDIAELTMAYLFRYGPHDEPVPELATVVPSRANGGISRDGRTIRYHLRRRVAWSDGAPFSAADVVFTIGVIRDPATNEAQGRDGWDLIDAARALDDTTVELHLTRPYAGFLPTFFGTAGNSPCVLPKHLLDGHGPINNAAYNAHPVGIGPFVVESWKRGDRLVLAANPRYWRGSPKLKRITFLFVASRETLLSLVQRGDVDVWPRVPPTYVPQLRAMPHVRLVIAPSLRTTHLDFQTQRPPGNERAVRLAVRDAIDRARIIATVEHGFADAHEGIVYPGTPLGNASAVPADVSAADRRLNAAGWRRGTDGIRERNGRRLVLGLVYQSGGSDLDGIVEIMRSELRAIGIELVTRTYGHALLFAPPASGGIVLGGRFEAALFSSTLASFSDVAISFSCAGAPPNGENYARYCRSDVDATIAQLKREYDPTHAARLARVIDDAVVADAPTFTLFVWKSAYAVNERVSGFVPGRLTSFDAMTSVDSH